MFGYIRHNRREYWLLNNLDWQFTHVKAKNVKEIKSLKVKIPTKNTRLQYDSLHVEEQEYIFLHF